jgi:hypothetical protein
LSFGKRGSTLIAVLLLISLLLVGGLGLLGRKALEYDRVAEEATACQALALAQSGLEDALVKFGKDPSFPPLAGADQTRLTYSEDVYRTDGSTLVGRYTVTIDRKLAPAPSYVALITSVGTIGPEASPISRHTVSAELNLKPGEPTYFKLLNFQDLGGL